MNLREFVASTLTEIHEGVRQAQEKIPGLCPPTVKLAKRPENYVLCQTADGRPGSLQFIEFDVACTASRDESGQATIGVAALGLGANIDTSTARQHISRVRFSVPLVLPADR